MKTYIYIVNGSEMEDTEVWGKAWKWAKETATEEHAVIERTIVRGNGTIEHEFYAKGGAFLNERFYEVEKVKIW